MKGWPGRPMTESRLRSITRDRLTAMLHKTAEERYEKLKKVYARLMRQFNRDDLDDFVLTANSLREWIRRDGTLTSDQKAALDRFVVDASLDWQICHQLANNQKHVGAR